MSECPVCGKDRGETPEEPFRDGYLIRDGRAIGKWTCPHCGYEDVFFTPNEQAEALEGTL